MDNASDQPTEMNPDVLYREETYTDRYTGAIKHLVPVTASGEVDDSRPAIFVGETQILLGNSPLPIHFEIDASTIGEAAEKFATLAQEEAQNTLKRLQELQRDMQNKIVVPGQGGPGGMGGAGGMGGIGGPAGGMGGPGGIQIP